MCIRPVRCDGRIPRCRRNTIRERGFTLLELLVVMIVIGILAAIAIPVFLQQRSKAYATSARADAKNIASALESATLFGTLASFTPGPNNTFIVTYANGSTDSYQIQPLSPGTAVANSWIDPSGTPFCVETLNHGQYAQIRETGMSTSTTAQCSVKPAGALG